jgi:predicted transcriptional regulator
VRKADISMSRLRRIELKTTADLSMVRQVAEHLALTPEQALAMHAIQHQEYRPAPGELKQMRRLLPRLDSGWIFRARRVQMGLSRDELAEVSGVPSPLISALEQISGVDPDVVRDVAPHLEITPAQAFCMLSIQRRRLIPECLRNLT